MALRISPGVLLVARALADHPALDQSSLNQRPSTDLNIKPVSSTVSKLKQSHPRDVGTRKHALEIGTRIT